MRQQYMTPFYFSGDENMNTTLAAAAVVDKTSSYPGLFEKAGVVDLTLVAQDSSDHGYTASPQPLWKSRTKANCIYIQGTDNYDGLRRIIAAPDGTSLYIVAPYTAETTATGDTVFPGLSFDEPWFFRGYRLHLDTASATEENLTINLDADRGSAWDYNIITEPMNTVKDIIDIFDEPIWVPAKDIVKAAWANTDDRTWGLELLMTMEV